MTEFLRLATTRNPLPPCNVANTKFYKDDKMDFEDFEYSLHKRWQKQLLLICALGSLIVIMFEVLSLAYNFKYNTNLTSKTAFTFLTLIIPSGINVSATIFYVLSLRSKKFSVNVENYIGSYAIFTICATVAIFHVYFKFLLVTTGLPLILCSIFANRKILSSMLVSCFLMLTISIFMLGFDNDNIKSFDIFLTIMCAICYIMLNYFISLTILNIQMERNFFESTFMERQNALIRELQIDPLTKLYNRISLKKASVSFIKKFQMGMMNPHLVIIDIGNLKDVNTMFGHSNGDKVLIVSAEIIKSNMGGIRRAFRISGERFAIMFEKETTDQVINKLKEIKDDIQSVKFDFANDLKISINAGIAKLHSEWDEPVWFNAAQLAACNAKAENPSWIIDYDSIQENVSAISVE